MSNDSVDRPHLIVTVHGIRTFGQWQERLEKLVRARCSGVEFVNYKYGYFSIIGFIVPFFRWLITRRFRNELIRLCEGGRRPRIDLVGHSFGTHMIAWGISRLPTKCDLTINTVILSGSVLRAGFPWRELIGKRVKRVVNDCGTRDFVLLLSQFLVLFTGMAGRTGFSGSTGNVFRNRYSVFGHSGYFQDARRKSTDLYMERYWVPLLLSDQSIEDLDDRQSSPFEGFVTWLADNAEPIKLMVYATPFVALTWWISGLYINAEQGRLEAERQRDLAYATESRFFAALAEQTAPSDPITAALIAIEGLPDKSSGKKRPFVVKAESQLYDAFASKRELQLILLSQKVAVRRPLESVNDRDSLRRGV